ncbi:MAG: hypothetical protein ABSE86_36785 [Bryobacteraceae bacterium]|jgi:uncharacterized protein (TIGR03437 family)
MGKLWLLPVVFTFGHAFAQPQIGGGTCSTASLSGNYAITLTGRQASSTAFTSVYQANGVATYDGQGNVTFALTANSNVSAVQAVKQTGKVSISSNCSGTLTFPNETFNLAVYNQGKGFLFSGTDMISSFSGTGSVQPATCVTALLSGVYAMNANGFNLSGTAISSVADITGLLQFDGKGSIVANWSMTSGTTVTQVAATGTYAVNTPTSCLGTATLADTNGKAYTFDFSLNDPTGANFLLLASGPELTFSGTGHSSFQNPSQSVGNGASFKAGETAPGSIFSIFGTDLGAAPGVNASVLPLPGTIGATQVTVNGETAPLFYAGPGQVNAQMPVDIAPGLATLVVSNGTVNSNAAAVTVPEAAPGIFTYGTNNHAVVINPSGATNADSLPAHVGDTVVAYFTGGGPVNPSGTWATGDPSPDGKSPVTSTNSITVNGKAAQVMYVGLSGGSVGLYQANFVIPQVVAGDHPLVITVNGVKSNSAAISIAE